MRISDWSSDVCSSDLRPPFLSPARTPKHCWRPQWSISAGTDRGAYLISGRVRARCCLQLWTNGGVQAAWSLTYRMRRLPLRGEMQSAWSCAPFRNCARVPGGWESITVSTFFHSTHLFYHTIHIFLLQTLTSKER